MGISADPAFAFCDTVRFLTLLFGENLSKVPEGLAIVARTMAAKGLSCGTRNIRSSFTGLQNIFARAAVPPRGSSAAVLAAEVTCVPGSKKRPDTHLGQLKRRCVRFSQLMFDLL